MNAETRGLVSAVIHAVNHPESGTRVNLPAFMESQRRVEEFPMDLSLASARCEIAHAGNVPHPAEHVCPDCKRRICCDAFSVWSMCCIWCAE